MPLPHRRLSNDDRSEEVRSGPARIAAVGGGAAGFFAAITCASASPEAKVTLLEKGPQFLAKVRISGGGRCNVTHACFDASDLCASYPRGARELLGAFRVFQPRDTIEWFESRGVKLKTEADGRMFPVTDSSQTIIDCLLREAQGAGVELLTNCGVQRVTQLREAGFELQLANGKSLHCDRLLLATGGSRVDAGARLAASCGHTLEPPVPSLLTFHVESPWLRELAGVSVESTEIAVPDEALRARGPVLMTHWGLSGPAILRLSAWGARVLHARGYHFPLLINWLPELNAESAADLLRVRRETDPARLVLKTPIRPLPARLWEKLVLAAGVGPDTRWSGLSRGLQHNLVQQLIRTSLEVTGKSLNKEEFVTCGGVRLSEVNFKTMESRICPGLYFAGELLDMDGLTGGFNFQAAWTTGWIAGTAIAQ